MRAQFWSSLKNNAVRCALCHQSCFIEVGKRGFCAVRENRRGELHTLVGDAVVSVSCDPVEKKPLYHYLPGSRTFSIGTMGCNFACAFCQNADISRTPARTGRVRGTKATPDQLVALASRADCASVAFTYNEPTVFYEMLAATADIAGAAGMGRILVSNGYQSRDCLETLGPLIDAANIDLKSFRDEFYRVRCKARLAPVLDNLKRMVGLGWWVEVTTLVIPGLNDDGAELRDIARFIREELGPQVPWHISAFHPCFELTDRPPTPPRTILSACEIGQSEGLFFVYPGNVPFAQPTRCPACGRVVVEQEPGWERKPTRPDWAGNCPYCTSPVPGLWEADRATRGDGR